MNRRNRVTIEDVAREAGVSRQTVSRAINNKREIHPETRRRVLEVVRELGYRPNSIARGLKTDRTLTIGLVVPDIANPFFAEVVRGASEVAHADDYGILLCNTDENPLREWSVLRMLESYRVDGLMLISSRLADRRLQEAMERWRPMVLVNREPAELLPNIGSVVVDDAEAAQRAVQHLISRGHRRIAFLGGSSRSRSGLERRRGYRQALIEAGLPAPARWCRPCAPTVDGGRTAAKALLSQAPEITAVLTYNDLVALGVVQACQSLGRHIPQDLALVGWDDIVYAPYFSPPLTTMRMPKYQIGEQAMRLLLELIRDPQHPPKVVRLDAKLIVRGST